MYVSHVQGGSRIDLLFAAAGRGDLATVNALLPSIEVTQIDNPPPDKVKLIIPDIEILQFIIYFLSNRMVKHR